MSRRVICSQVVERWLANAQTPVDKAVQVRHLIEQDGLHDLSGTQPFRNADGQWCFTQRTAIVVGRKLRPEMLRPTVRALVRSTAGLHT